jgi:hypothetical protein
VFAITLPLADAWLHEEWHRAVLSNRGIASRNDVYNLDLFASTIAVSHLRDEDLVRLKREHPAEQVRLQEAGIEGELSLATALEKRWFFFDAAPKSRTILWLLYTGVQGYVGLKAGEVDSMTDADNAAEGTDVARRDFTGDDFTGWTRDLFRPDEPYGARGVHPSGVGIDRYTKYAHLQPEERRFLEAQGRLSMLNLLDPNLLGFQGVSVGGWQTHMNLRHFLTPFGYSIDVNLFGKRDSRRVFGTLHFYRNHDRIFPGIEAEIPAPPLGASDALVLSPRVALWRQPRDQRFMTEHGSAGGLVSLRATKRIGARHAAFMELTGKSAGWVPGEVSLGTTVTLRTGFTVLTTR